MTQRKPAILFIFITLFLDILGIGLIIPVLPSLVEKLGGGGLAPAAYTFGFLTALYSLMQFIFAPIIGSLSDQFGRRPVILLALLGSGLDYFLLAWAPTIAWLFVGRFISGISGASFSAANAYIADISTKEKRAANFGIMGAAFGLGFICGPALGGWLGVYGLRVPFIAAGILTLLNWLYGMFILPESLKPENKRKFSFATANPLTSILDLRKQKLALGLSFAFFISNIAHQVFPSVWVLYTTHRYAWGTHQTGMSLALVGLMTALVQGGLGRVLIPKLGEKKSAIIGFTIMALSLVGYGLATKGWMVYCIIVFGSLAGIALPAIQGMISNTVGDDEQGGLQGSLTSLQSLARVISPIVVTSIFAYFISANAPVYLPGAAFFFSAILVGVAIIVAIRSFQHDSPPEAEEQVA